MTTKYSEPQRSFLNDLPVAGMIAGLSHSFTLELIDNAGMFVVTAGDSVQCVAVSDSGRATMAAVDFIRSKYCISLKLLEAGGYLVYCLVNSCCIKLAPYVVRVRPGLVAGAVAYLTLEFVASTSDGVYSEV
jgi:hypothetical protein